MIKFFHENLDKYFIENADKKEIEEVSKYYYNIIKNQENQLEEMNRELEDKDNKIKNFEDEYIRNRYGNKYKFDNDIDILRSFETIFNEKNISYKPYKRSKQSQIQYLLNKLENDTRVDKDLYKYFYNTLKNKKKLSLKIPTKNIIDHQDGEGLLNINKIKINTDLLNKNILSIIYLTGKKLTNKLLKDDYKISKNMVNAIKFNKDIHKLSKNEKNVYYEITKIFK